MQLFEIIQIVQNYFDALTYPILLVYFLNTVSLETSPAVLFEVIVTHDAALTRICLCPVAGFRNATVTCYDIHHQRPIGTPEGPVRLQEPEMYDPFAQTVVYIEEPEGRPLGMGIGAQPGDNPS